ncbi:hypothetical protein CDAR_246401 [Caerostris darwini]|uniref:Uncharacterized protein n=1 Tax=Caerostris darwini TaxID=1538125 RepID=A0AAV4W3K4_9ARAC|nr:hypothetical protein CDAR_246401 [Caerostris darwini]
MTATRNEVLLTLPPTHPENDRNRHILLGEQSAQTTIKRFCVIRKRHLLAYVKDSHCDILVEYLLDSDFITAMSIKLIILKDQLSPFASN